MQPFAPLLMVATIWIVAAVTPGPNFFMAVRVSATQSRARGLMATAGIATGTTLWGCAGFFGIHALFNAAPWLYLGFKIVGGLYVIYLGSQLIRHSHKQGDSKDSGASRPLSAAGAYRLGLMTNLANPKAALFMASVFASAMPDHPSLLLGALAIALMTTISITWYVFVSCLFTMGWIARGYERLRHWIDRVAGAIFIVFGAKLVLGK
jgi:RhtB (resistance to homoserine/threonine) family protein